MVGTGLNYFKLFIILGRSQRPLFSPMSHLMYERPMTSIHVGARAYMCMADPRTVVFFGFLFVHPQNISALWLLVMI
jgi:hypothetical protein